MKLSIIIPVFNEKENIRKCLNNIFKKIKIEPKEILIVYDFPKDNTLPVIKKYFSKNRSIKLIRNLYGQGALGAIKTGFKKARGEAILVTMADSSDRLADVNKMYQLYEQGTDLVCASRYMKGGKRIGGPFLQRFFSKFVGLTIHWIAGLPTKDVSNAFKLYSRKVLNSIRIESTGGFELSMEITLKAFFTGFKIKEIPTVWRGRKAGKSKFKMLSWLPKYLRWYWYAIQKAVQNSSKKQHLLALGIFIIAAAIFFWPMFLGKMPFPADIVFVFSPWSFLKKYYNIEFHNPLLWDPVQLYYPWRHYAEQIIQSGHLPLWNPLVASGAPFLANPQTAIFYPLNILFYILPTFYAFGLQIPLHLILAGFFMYLFLRSLRLSLTSAIFGGIAFMFNGVFIAWLVFPTFLSTMIWLPLILYLIEKFFQKPQGIIWAFLALTIGIQFLGGHSQMALYNSLIFVSYTIFRYFSINKIERRFSQLVLVALALVFGGLVAAIQLLPSWEYSHYIVRGKESFDSLIQNAIPRKHLITFLIPDFYGNPVNSNYWGKGNYTEYCGYLGIPTLFLAFVSLWHIKKQRFILYFGLLALLGLLLATGTEVVVLPFYKYFPTFDSIRALQRTIWIYAFAMIILAVFGLEILFKISKNNLKKPSASLRILIMGILIFGLVFFLERLLYINLGSIFPAIKKFEIGLYHNFALLLSLTLWCFLLFIYLKNRLFLKFLIPILFIDLFLFGFSYIPFTKSQLVFPATSLSEFFKKDKELYRIQTFQAPIFFPNTAMVIGLSDVRINDSFILDRYNYFINLIENQKGAALGNLVLPIQERMNLNSQLLDFLNVKYVLSTENIENLANNSQSAKFQKVFEDESGNKIFQNKKYFPRAFVVHQYLKVNDQDFEQVIREKAIDLGKVVLLSDDYQDLTLGPEKKDSTDFEQVQIESYEPNKILIEASLKDKGFLVISDNWYPGWEAQVNGQKTKILRANYSFRAVPLKAGRHQIKMEFKPKSYFWGLILTLLSIVILIAVILKPNLKKR